MPVSGVNDDRDNSKKISLWWEEGLYFKCLGCGRCCRGEPGAIWLHSSEAEKIAGFLGISISLFRNNYLTNRWGALSIKEKKNGDCFFYSSSNGCFIYPVRPQQCSLYPFWNSLLSSRENWENEANHCPGINNGDFYAGQMIAKLLDLSFQVSEDL